MPEKPTTVAQYLEIGCGRCALGGTPQCKVLPWIEELRLLRKILLSSGLTEAIKWGAPCYSHQGKNILMLSALKDSVVVSYFQGAQLPDPQKLLEKPGANSRFARYIRFTDTIDIEKRKLAIFDFIKAAVALKESDQPTDVSLNALPDHPLELTKLFAANPAFQTAFSALTPGRQRGYLLHFSSAKQSSTRTTRIEKCIPKIHTGKGWNER